MIHNPNELKQEIVRVGVRILRPSEYEALLKGCTKKRHRTMMQTLLYTGMRYIELQRFQEYPGWFTGEFIHLPRIADRKVHRTQPERWVRLNQQGRMIVEYFLQIKEPLPAYQNWRDNMRRWAKAVELSPMGMGAKTLRKTWESWLMFYYPGYMADITLSQGHDTITSIQHYLNMPFTELDHLMMKNYVEGWRPDANRFMDYANR
jgi:integrase